MKIISRTELVDLPNLRVIEIKIVSPYIAAKAAPGEFVVLMPEKKSERIPLTIVRADKVNGVITLIFQEAGFSTRLLGKMNAGDSLYALAGPLGHATEIRKYGKVILVGGGVGIAEIYPVAVALKAAGNNVTTILGARTKDILILEKELRSVSDGFYITTDDGSYGTKGFTTDILRQLLLKDKYDIVYAVGPIPMMKKVSAVTKEFAAKTMVSLNAIMIDGTGMCGGCRVTIDNRIKFTCVDGPEFDGHQIDWNELEKRNKTYIAKEKHICNLENIIK